MALLRKMTCNLRHPMSLCYPILNGKLEKIDQFSIPWVCVFVCPACVCPFSVCVFACVVCVCAVHSVANQLFPMLHSPSESLKVLNKEERAIPQFSFPQDSRERTTMHSGARLLKIHIHGIQTFQNALSLHSPLKMCIQYI